MLRAACQSNAKPTSPNGFLMYEAPYFGTYRSAKRDTSVFAPLVQITKREEKESSKEKNEVTEISN